MSLPHRRLVLRDRRADIADLFDQRGALKPTEQWPIEFRTGLVRYAVIEEVFSDPEDGAQLMRRYTRLGFADRTPIKRMIGEHANVGSFGTEPTANGETPRARRT